MNTLNRRAYLTVIAGRGSLLDGLDWMGGALCPEMDPKVFYIGKGGSGREAKRVCSRCPVRAECLADALAHRDNFGPGLYGIWGGTSPEERDRLARRFGADVDAAVAYALRDSGPEQPGEVAA